MKRVNIKFDKLIYVGLYILNLSKMLMYGFHYNYIVKKYVQRQKFLFTYTDSVAYEIKTEDFYQDISSDLEENLIQATMQKIIYQVLKLDAIKK